MKYLDQKQINSKLNTVKILATSIVILFSLQSCAQNSTYPTLPHKGAQIADFIPATHTSLLKEMLFSDIPVDPEYFNMD